MQVLNYAARQAYDWPLFSGNNSNTFSTPDTLPPILIRRNGYLPKASSVLAVSGGIIYVRDRDQANMIYAVDMATNTANWQYTLQGTANSIKYIIARDKAVYLLTASSIVALVDNGNSPSLRWSRPDRAVYFNFDGTRLFYTTPGESSAPAVVALDSSSGRETGRVNIGSRSDELGMLSVGGGRIFFTLGNPTADLYLKLYSLDASTLRLQWTAGLGNYRVPSSQIPAYMDGRVYLDYEPVTAAGTRQYLIAAFDALTGQSLWRFNTGGGFSHSGGQNRFTVNRDSVITMNLAGFLISINKDSGAERWRVRYTGTGSQGGQAPATTSSGLLISASDRIILNNNRKIKVYASLTGAFSVEFSADNLNNSPVAVSERTLILSGERGLSTYMPAVPGMAANKPLVTIQSIVPRRISPNEAEQPQTTVRLLVYEDMDVQMSVLNSTGQAVRTYPYTGIRSGTGYRYWDAKDNQGKPVPYGIYYFAFDMRDFAGNYARYAYPADTVTVGDIIAVALSDTTLRSGPGMQYSATAVIPTGANLTILDETGSWFRVNYYKGYPAGYVQGYVPKSQMSTYSNPVLVAVSTPVRYTVQPGDSLFKIAARYNTTIPLIAGANNLSNTASLQVGQVLTVPALTRRPVRVIHVVAAGDSLWKLSNLYKVPQDLITINNKVNPNNLVIGQKLLIK